MKIKLSGLFLAAFMLSVLFSGVFADKAFAISYEVDLGDGKGKVAITQGTEDQYSHHQIWRGDGSVLSNNVRAEDRITIKGTFSGSLAQEGSNVNEVIYINSPKLTKINLQDVVIDLGSQDGVAAMTVVTPTEVTLRGNNTLISGNNCAGIQVEDWGGSDFVIQGDGSLTATGNGTGAGIGGSYFQTAGNITIRGGTVTAIATGGGAGIGGSTTVFYNNEFEGEARNITISGGTVTARAERGAAIGAGENDGNHNGANLTITGTDTVVNAYTNAEWAMENRNGYGFTRIEKWATLNITGGKLGRTGLEIRECTIDGGGEDFDFSGTYRWVTLNGATMSATDKPSQVKDNYVKAGATVTLTPSRGLEEWEEDYTWTVTPNDLLVEEDKFWMPAEDVNVTYTPIMKSYDITYDNLGGATNDNPMAYQYGGGFELQDPGERENFEFRYWTDEDGDTVTEVRNDDYGDRTLTANWRPVFSGEDPEFLLDLGGALLAHDAGEIVVRIFDNLDNPVHTVKYRVTVTDRDGGETVLEKERTGAETEFRIPIGAGDGVGRVFSLYDEDTSDYVPSYDVVAELLLEGNDFYPVEGELYMLPPVVAISAQADIPSAVTSGDAPLMIPFALSNFSETTGYTFGYEIRKNGEPFQQGAGSNTAPLAGFGKSPAGGFYTYEGIITVPVTIPDAGLDIYILTVYGKNNGQAANAIYTRQIKVINASPERLTVTYYNSANGTTDLPGTGGAVSGFSHAQLAAMTAEEAYDSQGVYDYIMKNRLGNNHLSLNAPEEWGRVRYRVNDAADDNGQPVWSSYLSQVAAYALAYTDGGADKFTFEWENTGTSFTLDVAKDALNGRIFLFYLGGRNGAATFRWRSGGEAFEKTITPTSDGYYAVYAPEGMEGVEAVIIDKEKSYTGALENPRSVFSGGGDPGITRKPSLPGGDYRRAAPNPIINRISLSDNASLRLSFVEANGANVSETVGVNFFFVDKDFKAVAVPGAEESVSPGEYALINIKPMLDNKEYMVLAEITREGKKPMLYVLEYQSLFALGGGTQDKDVLLKLSLPGENGEGALTIQPALLRDETGMRQLYGSSSMVEGFYDKAGASYTVIIPESAVSGTGNLSLVTGPTVTLKQTGAVTTLGPETLPSLDNSYIMATYDLKDRFAKDQRHTNIRLKDGDRTVAYFVGLVSRSETDDIRDLLTAFIDLPDFSSLGFNGLNNSGGGGGLLQKLADFKIETPGWGPISFALEKSGDTYYIKCVASFSAMPGPPMDPEEVLSMFKQISDFYHSNGGGGITLSDKFARPFGHGGSVFAGMRFFASVRATMNKVTGNWDFEFNDGGVIGELSATASSRLSTVGLWSQEIAFTISGKMASTLAFTYPTKAARDKASNNFLVDISIESMLAASLSAKVGFGADLVVVSGYAGITGGAGASVAAKAIISPYLSDENGRERSGFKMEANGNLGLYVTGQVLLWEKTVYHDLLSGEWLYLDPGNESNPYHPNFSSYRMTTGNAGFRAVGERFQPLDASLFSANTVKSGLDASAAMQYYSESGYYYKDIGDPDDYNDDRIRNENGEDDLSVGEGPEYALSVAFDGDAVLAAYEVIDGEVDSDDVVVEQADGVTDISAASAEALNSYLNKTEIVGAFLSGGEIRGVEVLSHNALMDMAPETAYNDEAERGIVVWTRGSATAGDGSDITDVSAEGELVCSVFSVYDSYPAFGKPIALMALPGAEEPQIVSVVPAVGDDGTSLVLVRTGDGRITFIRISADKEISYSDTGISAMAADLVWNGENFVLGYVDADEDFALMIADGDSLERVDAETGLAGRVGLNFQFARDREADGMASLAIVWHELAENGEGKFVAQFMGALIAGGSDDAVQFSAPQPIDGPMEVGLSVASFDTKLDTDTNTISLLAVCAQGTAAIAEELSESFENKVSAAVVSFDTDSLKPGQTSEAQLIVQNDGLVSITDLTVEIGGNTPVLVEIPIAPATSVLVTVPYTPEADKALPSALNLKVTADFGGGAEAFTEWTHNIYMVDVAVSLLNFTNTDTDKSALVSVSGMSDLILDSASSVKLGVYYDSYGTEQAGEPVTLSGGDIASIMEAGFAQSLAMPAVTEQTQLYIVASISDGSAEVLDIDKANNSVVVLMEPDEGISGITEITLSSASLELKTGASEKLIPTVTPDNPINKEVLWSTGDPSVATVQKDGTVTAVSAGTAVITASSSDGSVSAQCTVTVIPEQAEQYTVTFDPDGGVRTGGGALTQTVSAGGAATAPVVTRNGYTFNGWSMDFSNITASITVTALWIYNGGGGGAPSPSYTPPLTVPVNSSKQPGMPTVASVNVNGTVKDGILSAVITESMARTAISAATDRTDGIAVDFNVIGSGDYKNLSATFERAAFAALRTAGVKYVQIGSEVIDVSVDMAAINGIFAQTSGNVTVSAIGHDRLSAEAKAIIGGRPAFDITVKGAGGAPVSDLRGGIVTIAIAYTPTAAEKAGNIYAVYVPANGKPQLLENSGYKDGRVIFERSSLSVYGVGYRNPAPAFTDVSGHWAKEYIDFAASRELIAGTAAALYSPNTAITRADFLMALGKLSGRDVSGYKTSGFSDVANANPAMPYIEWAVANKIVAGIGGGKFGLNAFITRQDMAVMMINYANATGYTLPVSQRAITFADDASISVYAQYAVKAIQQTGVIVGKTGNRFDPQGNMTRGEAATVIRRFIELVIDEGTARGWRQNDSGGWQYTGENGKPVTGWLTSESGKYWFDDQGVMAFGQWVQIGGKWYYFGSDGKLAVNTAVDGYAVGPDGARK